MNEGNQKAFFWIMGIAIVGTLIFTTSLNPFKENDPSWQVIKEGVAATVYCDDWEYDSEGYASIGFGPCLRLTNVTYDSSGDGYHCYSTDVEIGGYPGQNYSWINSWSRSGNEYYCVTWIAKYVDPDINDPSHWRIDFGEDGPDSYLRG